jgi:hypothetical protein
MGLFSSLYGNNKINSKKGRKMDFFWNNHSGIIKRYTERIVERFAKNS